MAVSAAFNEELALVDPARSFTYQSAYSDYGENEWSVAGWVVYGGSDAACEHGASEAMYQMGYRWYAPEKTVRPVTLPSGGVTLARQQFVFPFYRLFYNYGYALWADHKQASFDKWAELNCMNDGRRPAGHAWPSIISAIEAEDGFFTTNPTYYTGTIGHAGSSFNLALTGADYTALVDRVALWLAGNLYEGNRRHFDPQDGNPSSSDVICGFANDVVAKVRETVPDATLGIYAYAGHRLPPTIACPHLYVLVALQFNDTGLTYMELIDGWGQQVGEVGLRGYGMIAANKEIGPFSRGLCNDTFLETALVSFSAFRASGTNALTMESSGHHIAGLVGYYSLLRYMRDGVTSHADVRDDLEIHMPEFTAATKALYEHWGTNLENLITISKSYDLIDALPDNALSTEIKRYWTWYRHMRDVVDVRLAVAKDGRYYSALELNLRMGKRLQDDHTAHGYAHARQEANTNVNERMDLHHDNNAHWERFPVYPSDELYNELKTAMQSTLQRPTELEDTTLALCEATPLPGLSLISASDFTTAAVMSYAYIGPGTVTTDEGSTVYGSGIHYFEARGTVSFSGGLLFMNTFPSVYLDDTQTGGRRWIYIPKMVRGRPYLASSIRAVVEDGVAEYELSNHLPPFATPGTGKANDPRQMLAGQCWFRQGLCRGDFININCNPWISPQFDRALIPKALAVREGLTILSEY